MIVTGAFFRMAFHERIRQTYTYQEALSSFLKDGIDPIGILQSYLFAIPSLLIVIGIVISGLTFSFSIRQRAPCFSKITFLLIIGTVVFYFVGILVLGIMD